MRIDPHHRPAVDGSMRFPTSVRIAGDRVYERWGERNGVP